MASVNIKRLAKKFVGAEKQPDIHVVSSADFLRGARFNPVQAVFAYVRSLFPIINWIGHYNLGWLSGDVIAGESFGGVSSLICISDIVALGLTVGMILIPQR